MENAWVIDNDVLTKNMINGALAKLPGFSKLEDTSHFKILNELITIANINEICDLGCGAGELGRVMPTHKYIGYDLPHIVKKVSKFVNPNLNFVEFDANNFDYSLLKNYKLIVLNSFISELHNGLEILSNILENSNGFVVLHRQKFADKTSLRNYNTYGGLKTVELCINFNEFKSIIKNHTIVKMVSTLNENSQLKSLLLCNKNFKPY